MKYKLVFNYVGVKEEYEVSSYYFQPPGIMLLKKKTYEGKVLRADEKDVPFKFINLGEVIDFDIEEIE